MKLTETQIKRTNLAFDRVQKAIVKYLNDCFDNGAPVKNVRVRGTNRGVHVSTGVRYYRIT